MNRALTHQEKGAFLIALGTEMNLHNLSAGAALDGESTDRLVNCMMRHGVDGATAREILGLVELEFLSEEIDGNL